MSRFFCQDVHALLSHEPDAPLPEVALDEEVTYQTPSDEELIAAVRQVCGAGWFRALANRLRVADLLDDVAQTTFLNVWRARETFDPAYPVVCRVARIGRNALIDAARGRGRRSAVSLYADDGEKRYDPADRDFGPAEQALGREMAERLAAEVAAAPEQIRRVLALLDRDMTFDEVAAALGKNKSAITSAYHRWKVATLGRLLRG
jgi:RNA polymerase sigma factor (sigma-70 family)